MADRSARLDRVSKPDPRAPRRRDEQGKEALYSTAPSAAPSSQVLILCRRCDVESGVTVVGFLRTLRPPVFLNPITRHLWARCPACRRHSWLDVRSGQALRVLVDRSHRR